MRTFNGTTQSLNIASGFTDLQLHTKAALSCWARRTASGDRCGVGSWYNTQHRFGVVLWTDGNVYAIVSSGSVTEYAYCALSGTGVHHLAMNFDGTLSGDANRLKLWVDGSQQTLTFQDPVPGSLSSQLVSFEMGRRYGTEYGAGAAGLCGVWAGAVLTAQNIADLYAGSVGPDDITGNLVAAWLTLEDTGTAFDETANSYDLTAENGPGFEENPVGAGGGTSTRFVIPPRIVRPVMGFSRARRGV